LRRCVSHPCICIELHAFDVCVDASATRDSVQVLVANGRRIHVVRVVVRWILVYARGVVCSGNPKQCYFEGVGGISVERVFNEVKGFINQKNITT